LAVLLGEGEGEEGPGNGSLPGRMGMVGISGPSPDSARTRILLALNVIFHDSSRVSENARVKLFSFFVSLSLMIQQYNVMFTRTMVSGRNFSYNSQGGMRFVNVTNVVLYVPVLSNVLEKRATMVWK